MRIFAAFLGVLLALVAPVAARGDANVLLTDSNATSDSSGALISVSPSGVQKAVSTNALSTAAGGPALFSQPADVAVSPDGTLYVLDYQSAGGGEGRIDKIDPATGKQTTVSTNAVSQAAGGQQRFFAVQGLLVGLDGFLYVTDTDVTDPVTEGGIIRVNPASGAQTLVASDTISSNQGGETAFHNPYDSVQLPDGSFATVDDPSGSNGNSIAGVIGVTPSGKQSYLSTNAISVAAGGQAVFNSPHDITRGPDGVLYVTDGSGGGTVIRVEPTGKATLLASGSPTVESPFGIDYASDGNLYVADFNSGGAGTGGAVLRIAPSSGAVTVVSTNASSLAAGGSSLFNAPSGLLASGVPSPPPAASHVAPAAAKPQCSNGIDDDQDGAIDLKDPGCSSASDNVESDETASDLVLCGRRSLSLVRADVKGRKVVLSGIVAARLVGQKVKLIQVLGRTRKTLATVKPAKTGAFTAKVARPAARSFARARYVAQVGSRRSTALKLPQSLASSGIRKVGPRIEIRGSVKRSLLGKRKPILIRRLVCGRYRTVATVKADRVGRYKASFPAPALGGAALYRAEGQVLARPGSKRYVKQYARALAITFTGQSG